MAEATVLNTVQSGFESQSGDMVEMTERTWLVKPKSGLTGFGIAFSDDMLWVEAATPCCGTSMWADSGWSASGRARLGKPKLVCKKCGARWNWSGNIPRMNYSVFALVEDGPAWIKKWVGWGDAMDVKVDWTG